MSYFKPTFFFIVKCFEVNQETFRSQVICYETKLVFNADTLTQGIETHLVLFKNNFFNRISSYIFKILWPVTMTMLEVRKLACEDWSDRWEVSDRSRIRVAFPSSKLSRKNRNEALGPPCPTTRNSGSGLAKTKL